MARLRWPGLVDGNNDMMKVHPHAALTLAAVCLALLRGVGEFAHLQRWRLRDWLAR